MPPTLPGRLTPIQAASLNMAMMVGIGPFLTIPALFQRVGGRGTLGIWALGAIVALCDGLVWSELAAAFPGSGGTYHFYDAIYGASRAGRLLKFLFVWQFLFSAPLEVASGAIGFARYAGYFSISFDPGGPWSAPSPGRTGLVAMVVMACLVALAYRRIEVAGRVMVVLWAGAAITVVGIIVAGFARFDPRLAFGISGRPWHLDPSHVKDGGVALGLAMYTYLGYYQVCYLGDEVAAPERTIPRSILLSVVAVAFAYGLMTLAMMGAVAWPTLAKSDHVASDFMRAVYGTGAAAVVTGFILWTAAAGTFAALLGYARVPYAAAKAGHFFRGLAHVHPTAGFPDRALLLIGLASVVACLADLETVIAGLLASRILIQFLGQAATVVYVRSRPDLRAKMTFRMWLFPAPVLVASAGWLCVFAASDAKVLAYAFGTMAAGLAMFLAWDGSTGKGRPRDEEFA